MALPESAYITIGDGLRLCRVTSGMWQLSGGHGFRPEPNACLRDMCALIDAGFTSFDLADHYGPAEQVVGLFRKQHPDHAARATFMTKWVPRAGPMPKATVLEAFDESRANMQMKVLDSVQLHWWDYDDNRYLELMLNSQILKREGVLRNVAVTNFDTEHLRNIVKVSFSVVDTRPLDHMVAFCQLHNIALLCYGSILGGFLSETWLGAAEPVRNALPTSSLSKYYNFIKGWGAWALFQELLQTLKSVAEKHSGPGLALTISAVAMSFSIMFSECRKERPDDLLGMRLGHTASNHIEENKLVFKFELDPEDLARIQNVQRKAMGNDSPFIVSVLGNRLRGDCGDEYRR